MVMIIIMVMMLLMMMIMMMMNLTMAMTVKSFTFLLQKINFTDQFYAPPVVMVTAERVNNDSHLSGCNAITAWVEVREETDWSTAYFTPV